MEMTINLNDEETYENQFQNIQGNQNPQGMITQ